jgi:hypothetical protein
MELFSFGSKPEKPGEVLRNVPSAADRANDKGQVAAFDRFAAHHDWIIETGWARHVQLI